MARDLKSVAAELAAVDREVLLAVAIVHGFELLSDEVRAISRGDDEGPGGLEALTVGVAGAGLRDSLTKAVRAHGANIQSVGDALRGIADLLVREVKP